jgi:hypothetical protein
MWIEQDMAVDQFLGVGAVLEVFLEGVLADVGCGADGGDGRFVDDLGAVFGGHVCDCKVRLWYSLQFVLWFCLVWFRE